MSTDADAPDGFEDRLRQRTATLHPLNTVPVQGKPRGNIPNTLFTVSVLSFLLGNIFALGLVISLARGLKAYWWTTYQLGFFVAAWAAFHWAEFAVTAGWNLEKCSVDSFLLDNGLLYHAANGTALVEYLLILYFKPSYKTYPYISFIGILITILGQTLRSAAMIHASTNFSHAVAYRKQPDHRLVTDGVYAWFRHPSYAGFFYWALGTQLVLQNVLSFVVFIVLLWRFFYYRTREERMLLSFFGEDYANYRRRVGTWIPFVP